MTSSPRWLMTSPKANWLIVMADTLRIVPISRKGKTPVLPPAEACGLLDSIVTDTLTGLRDRALTLIESREERQLRRHLAKLALFVLLIVRGRVLFTLSKRSPIECRYSTRPFVFICLPLGNFTNLGLQFRQVVRIS